MVRLFFVVVAFFVIFASPPTAAELLIRPKARPEQINRDCPKDATAEAQCLRCAVYHEARGEELEGKVAVALVILNRVKSPKFPNTICTVVWQRGYVRKQNRWYGQFSFTTEKRTTEMTNTDSLVDVRGAVDIAVIIDKLSLGVDYIGIGPDVLWYHTELVKPSWSKRLTPVEQIGTHQFYSP